MALFRIEALQWADNKWDLYELKKVASRLYKESLKPKKEENSESAEDEEESVGADDLLPANLRAQQTKVVPKSKRSTRGKSKFEKTSKKEKDKENVSGDEHGRKSRKEPGKRKKRSRSEEEESDDSKIVVESGSRFLEDVGDAVDAHGVTECDVAACLWDLAVAGHQRGAVHGIRTEIGGRIRLCSCLLLRMLTYALSHACLCSVCIRLDSYRVCSCFIPS